MAKGIAVNVAVRVRPLLANEDIDVIKYIHDEPPILVVQDRRNAFAFDHIFSNTIHQCEVYNTILKPLVSRVLQGYNCTILAYGQTGTGKTYTMGTDSQKYNDNAGLIPRVLDEFLEIALLDDDIQISVSFIEIYNEKVFDLLGSNKTALSVKGFVVRGMICEPVNNNDDARKWLLLGGKNRHVGHTVLNASSSRSHAVFTVYYTKASTGITSKLHLVDLAGSEGVRRTGNQGRAFKEGVTINKGLLAIGRVITALSHKHITVIPYRDSMLTTILHDSLNSDNYVSLLACVSPSDNDILETLVTLRFAVDAKAVRSKPQLETMVADFDKYNPGVLGIIPPTTVKKRRHAISTYTSTQIKKPKNTNTTSDSPTYTTMDSLSVSTSTMLSNVDAPRPTYNFSPLVRKCTETLHTTVLEQMSTMLQTHFTPAPALKINKKDTPPLRVSWESVENRITQLIRSVVKNTFNQSIIHTSPPVKKQLDFNSSSPLATRLEGTSPYTEDTLFKLPIGRPTKRKKAIDSPIRVQPRRSGRLSMMHLPSAPTPAPRFNTTEAPKTRVTQLIETDSNCVPRRRSIRLQQRPELPNAQNAPKPKIRQSVIATTIPTPAPRRRSVMIQRKLTSPSLDFATLDAKSPRHALQKHHEKTLNLLNTGTQKQLQILPTVGVKTALQLFTYRNIHGPFNSYDDLKRIPIWRGKAFDRFMLANQLI